MNQNKPNPLTSNPKKKSPLNLKKRSNRKIYKPVKNNKKNNQEKSTKNLKSENYQKFSL